MPRVLILGSPGSGKSRLARSLSASTGVRATDLDAVAAIAYRTGLRPRPVGPLVREAARLAGQNTWIAEGVFIGWTEALRDRASQVVVLKTPLVRCLWRVVRRHLAAGLPNQHGGVVRLFQFCFEIVDYYRNRNPDVSWPENPDRTTLVATLRFASKANDRLAVLATRHDIDEWMRDITAQSIVGPR